MLNSRFVGAHALVDGALIDAPVSVSHGVISTGKGVEVDFSGYLLLPGIIDLHGDAFERHIAPRPVAPFDKVAGLASTDREIVANGITTAYLAQCWSWEDGIRGPDYAEAVMQALVAYRPRMLADLRMQLRYETHMVDTVERLRQAILTHGIDYLIFNDHLPQALDMSVKDPMGIAVWAKKNGRTREEHMQIVHAHLAKGAEVPESMRDLSVWLQKHGIPFGSHDDSTPEQRELFDRLGATICEFPTTREAASTARHVHNPVLMGAPNVVRGGSQSGNISAADLISDDLCDVLVSDYYYPAMTQSVDRLVADRITSFERAWAMISTNAADVMGLDDRGRIAPGLRADLVVMNAETRVIEATLVGGKLAYASGGAAMRLMSAGLNQRIAAA